MGDSDKKIALNQFKYLLKLDEVSFTIRVYKGKSPSGERINIDTFYWTRNLITPKTLTEMNIFFNKYGHKEVDSINIITSELFLNIILEDDLEETEV